VNNQTKIRFKGFSNKKLLLVCLGLSVVLWIFTALSEAYEHNVSCQVQYMNLPDDLIPVFPLTNDVELRLRGSGFDLLKLSKPKTKKVQIDYELFGGTQEILNSELKGLISDQLSNFYIEHVRPTVFPFSFQTKQSKKVPIVLKKQLTTNNNWFVEEHIQLTPDSVLISGPEDLMDTLQSWPTNLLKLKNLESNQVGTIGLKNSSVFNLSVEPAQCNYAISVDQWTEKTMDLPILSINLPKEFMVFLFPKQAKLRFRVPLKQYESLKEAQFKLVADFEKTQISKENKVTLRLETEKQHIRNVRIEPSSVEFVVSRVN